MSKIEPFGCFSIIDHPSAFGKFFAQLTPTTLLNPWIWFDLKNNQLFSKYNARKLKFRRSNCIKIGNYRFAIIFSFRMSLKQKYIIEF